MPNRTSDTQPSGASRERANEPSPDSTNRPDAVADELRQPVEIGGRGGLDPTRYGDWEKNGRCIDF